MSPIHERIATLLAHNEPFSLLPEAQREALLQQMTMESYPPGEVILQQGEDIHRALYLVESGVVRLTDVETDRTVDLVGEGAQFGSYGLLQGGALPYEARAVERTWCALFAAETFDALVQEHEPFQAYFEDDLKRYVRTIDDDIDASGAFLLFDTTLGRVLRAEAPTVSAEATVQDAAQAMSSTDTDSVVVVKDGAPVGVVTEGDLVERVVAAGGAASAPVMSLVDRPPIALPASARLFDAVRTMMEHRVRRIVVLDAGGGLLGLLTSEQVNHYRGLDPVATTERLERAQSISEMAALRADSNRRLYRLYHQGVHSEDLLGVVTEVDDQLKMRLIELAEAELRAERGDDVVDGPWAWLTFGASGRNESVLQAWQDNGLVYADPDGDAERAADYYQALAERITDAMRTCGYAEPENVIVASNPAFCQPLAQWQAAYAAWAGAESAADTASAALCFDVRALWGDEGLAEAIRRTLAEHLPSPRLSAVLAREGTRIAMPLTTFGRFDVDEVDGATGLDLRARGLTPVVHMARALALETAFLEPSNTFARLRHVAGSEHPLADTARALVPAFGTLTDFTLRAQMQAAERGETPTDRVDPDVLHKSQQNLLKETFQAIESAQKAVRSHYGL